MFEYYEMQFEVDSLMFMDLQNLFDADISLKDKFKLRVLITQMRQQNPVNLQFEVKIATQDKDNDHVYRLEESTTKEWFNRFHNMFIYVVKEGQYEYKITITIRVEVTDGCVSAVHVEGPPNHQQPGQ